MDVTRRDFVKLSTMVGVGLTMPTWMRRARAIGLAAGLSDPALQPKFVNPVPNALAPGFIYTPDKNGEYHVAAAMGSLQTGLVDGRGRKLRTTIFGYKGKGQKVTWPGRTFQVRRDGGEIGVHWTNSLPKYHLLPVDTHLHWCYSLTGASSANGVDYSKYSIRTAGVPMITHLHGGHSDYQFDGNPEFFHSPGNRVVGPQWDGVPGGFTNSFKYDNDVPAGTLWYHDHALGITRLNVYAGMAGFYFVRDSDDTGDTSNTLGLPSYPYEMALAIQDRMFTDKGALFYPAFPGDPFYDDFITGEGAVLPPDLFPGGGPTALAEFFGDHMVVNGLIWPKTNVARRTYRLRLLNGCDSRFLAIRFRPVNAGVTDPADPSVGAPIPFHCIGSDQGLGTPRQLDTLVFEPGARYDVLIDFSDAALKGKRVIMENIGGDAPFGGDFGSDLPAEDLFPDRQTDRVMAFDVSNAGPGPTTITSLGTYGGVTGSGSIRKVALFEGKDEFGRLQPLLGAYVDGNWKAIAWHSPTTEEPAVNTVETWEIYNFTEDAHPIHLHLVNFEILGRNEITFDASEDPGQEIPQHNGETGTAPSISNVVVGNAVNLGGADGYYEDAPKDMVTALPGQMTKIKALFDKSGRYVWHCHILSHEDHEMMRVLNIK
ncbi:MAG: multicopper oxidase family protein [Planctomycetota bacterium]